jgi:H+/Cl- antiporter ClcA
VRLLLCILRAALNNAGAARGRWKRGVLLSQGIAPMENQDWFQQLPLFVLVSMGGGLLGAAFNAAHKAMFRARRPSP